MSDQHFFPEISDSESSDTSSPSDEKTPEVSINDEKIDNDSTKNNVNDIPSSNENPEKELRLSNKILSKWPGNDLLLLLDRIRDTVPENDSTKFSKQVKKIVWDNIAFKDHSGNDCKSVWSTMQKSVRKERTLEEMLSEVDQGIREIAKSSNKSRKTPQTPFQIYYERQIKSAPTSSETKSALKKQYKEKWKNLNKDEKIVFINLAVENERKFNQELEDFDEKPKYKSILNKADRLLLSGKQADIPQKPPHSAYSLFSQIQLNKDEVKHLNIKERMKLVATRWNNCPQETKAKYISATSELKEKYKSDYDAYLRSLTEEEQRQEESIPKSKKRKLSPKDSEIKRKRKMESPERNNLVKPELPPTAPELFAQTLSDKNINADQAWYNLSDIQKRKYKKEVDQLHTKYLADFEAYVKATMENQLNKTGITASTTSEKDAETSTSSSSSSKESVSDHSDNESENEVSDSEDSSLELSNSEKSKGNEEDDSSDGSN